MGGSDTDAGNSTVIVAIPSQDNYVWKVSSEKIPHLTLLYLGEDVEDVDHIVEYVGHAADTMLSNFYLDVSHRGKLGPNDADVAFFENYNIKRLREFRNYLLSDTAIAQAFFSADQYPNWTPHLTLGYPETPAHPIHDEDGYPGLRVVSFDRIAVWTGDYEGIVIPLKRYDSELAEPYGGAGYWSEQGERFLEHYGVKGMKWGVIRDRGAAGARQAAGKVKEAYKPSQDAIRAQQYMTRAKLGGVRNLDNREMQQVINRMNLERQYKELYGERQWHNAGVKWAKNFVEDVLKDVASSWLRNPFASRGGPPRGDSPIRTTAVINGQSFAGAIEGPRRAIGR